MFAFTEREDLFQAIGPKRFEELLADPDTVVLEAEVSTNSYGEFLFVTVQFKADAVPLTFWNLGYHEYRDRYVTDKWEFYESGRSKTGKPMDPKQVAALFAERQAEINLYAIRHNNKQSQRGQVYDMIAEISDEDGAITDLEDAEDRGEAFWD